jgi:hypothetical protein
VSDKSRNSLRGSFATVCVGHDPGVREYLRGGQRHADCGGCLAVAGVRVVGEEEQAFAGAAGPAGEDRGERTVVLVYPDGAERIIESREPPPGAGAA